MPTKRIFDLVVLTALALHPAVGLVKMECRRLARNNKGLVGTVGVAGTVLL